MAQVGMETLDHILSLMEAFKAFNADNDGRITEAELGGIIGALGYKASDQEMRAMMQQGEKNKDGLLCINEFLELNTKRLETGNLANILGAAFEALDEDGNEILTVEELHDVVENLGLGMSLEKCQNIVTSLDMSCELG